MVNFIIKYKFVSNVMLWLSLGLNRLFPPQLNSVNGLPFPRLRPPAAKGWRTPIWRRIPARKCNMIQLVSNRQLPVPSRLFTLHFWFLTWLPLPPPTSTGGCHASGHPSQPLITKTKTIQTKHTNWKLIIESRFNLDWWHLYSDKNCQE